MATVYSHPETLSLPELKDFKNDFDALQKAEDQFIEDLKAFCKSESNCPDAGEEINFPIADGQARYIVYNYRTLIHVQTCDAYAIPDAHARGLRKADIVQKIQRRNNLRALFARS